MFQVQKDVKKKWLEALRSGEYEQTQDYLKDNKGFCCLGVLCDLYIKENNLNWEVYNFSYIDEDEGLVEETKHALFGERSLLPQEVIEWAKIRSNYSNQSPWVDEIGNGLVGLNDTDVSFNEIADIIEKYSEEVE